MSSPALGFLHTAAAQVGAFDALLARLAPGLRAHHGVDPDLLVRARAAASADGPQLAADVQRAMRAVGARGAAVVVCTCSSIGDVAEATPTEGHFQALRIDRPMADEATAADGRVLVVAALESTLAPTVALLEDSARRQERRVELIAHTVADAWAHYEAGRLDSYYQSIARAVARAAGEARAVVLAQASMAPAASLCRDVSATVLSSPETGIRAALAALAR